jgi:hypothetical protein
LSVGDPANGGTVFANEILQNHDWPRDETDWSDDRLEKENSEASDNNGERPAEVRSDDDPDDLD